MRGHTLLTSAIFQEVRINMMCHSVNICRLLPNADELDAESETAWRDIKTGLGTAFAVGEVRPAGTIWINK